jgi:hypothetical protein
MPVEKVKKYSVTILGNHDSPSSGPGVYRGQAPPQEGDVIKVELGSEIATVQVEDVGLHGSIIALKRPLARSPRG